MLVPCSNQLSYEATDDEAWSFVGSNVPLFSLKLLIKLERYHEFTKRARFYETNNFFAILIALSPLRSFPLYFPLCHARGVRGAPVNLERLDRN